MSARRSPRSLLASFGGIVTYIAIVNAPKIERPTMAAELPAGSIAAALIENSHAQPSRASTASTTQTSSADVPSAPTAGPSLN